MGVGKKGLHGKKKRVNGCRQSKDARRSTKEPERGRRELTNKKLLLVRVVSNSLPPYRKNILEKRKELTHQTLLKAGGIC